MKKTLSLLFALVLALSLMGCDSLPGEDNGGSGEGYPDEEGYASGYVGTVMHNKFFDFTVNSAALYNEYEGFAPEEGKLVLVTELTIKNTFQESIPMFDTDFQLQWNSDSEDDDNFAWPVLESVSDDQLPESYELAVQEERTGILVFEVPTDFKDFSLVYLEEFDDDTTGNIFFVYFTADTAGVAA